MTNVRVDLKSVFEELERSQIHGALQILMQAVLRNQTIKQIKPSLAFRSTREKLIHKSKKFFISIHQNTVIPQKS